MAASKDFLAFLIQSKVKRKLLKLFIFNKNKKFHVRELSRIINEPLSAVQREIKKLHDMQLLIKTPENRVINYHVNSEIGFYEDLKSLVLKLNTNLVDCFKILIKSDQVKDAWIIGEAVSNQNDLTVPIRLIVIGPIAKDVLQKYVEAIQTTFGRNIQAELVEVEDDLDSKLLKGKKIVLK